ncbi:hypothetical protein HYH02_008914 [Chlamydomonas schloesseri]|uniref:Uncharacterized protein n=1 Tax=Chlamydomonas schloesseri TaxID=2026947 RepID=A0A835WCV7_9CHLO|nr:hypothetical protein HYH02_008914 [Chlamydomonas schloesseri]|eukprot:KAG2445046.1 hypothetical protein HYH02_008914 [Chlamydomonas schloesseri]
MSAVLKAQPCGVLRGARPFAAPVASPRLARLIASRAGDGPTNDGPSTSGAGVQNKEAELERLEAAIRGKGPAPAAPRPPSAGMSGTKSGAKPIPIRGMTQQQNKIDSQYENMAPWAEGQLFPEGWDRMDLGTKLTELYLGRRGVLFWANKAAYASVFVLLGGWILFRFVGPALGLYKLAGEFAPPPI